MFRADLCLFATVSTLSVSLSRVHRVHSPPVQSGLSSAVRERLRVLRGLLDRTHTHTRGGGRCGQGEVMRRWGNDWEREREWGRGENDWGRERKGMSEWMRRMYIQHIVSVQTCGCGCTWRCEGGKIGESMWKRSWRIKKELSRKEWLKICTSRENYIVNSKKNNRVHTWTNNCKWKYKYK